MQTLTSPSVNGTVQGPTDHDVAAALRVADRYQRSGEMVQAIGAYHVAIKWARLCGAGTLLAESLRRLGVIHHHRNESKLARTLCDSSYALARALNEPVLEGEALNVLAGFDFEGGRLDDAQRLYTQALNVGGESATLRARIEQNLGILRNIRGEVDDARGRYLTALSACEVAGDERGQAIALQNLGIASGDDEHWVEADGYLERSRVLAERCGDVYLQALCALNHVEVHVARQLYDRARTDAEFALSAFDRQGMQRDKADAYRMLGVVHRETGALPLAEVRLRAAVQLARECGAILEEAEAGRELGRLYQVMGRNQEALAQLAHAHRLFGRLDARRDLVDVTDKRKRLEDTYLSIVREWGQSIESADSYTHGHCERVANYSEAVARALGADELRMTTIRLGAYLHDLGKVRVPPEILNKPGKLTPEEFAIIQQHPVWGLEMLAAVEFPWDLKPIIRSHHERYDGTGYPDALRGEEIPVDAQIICIADVYDAMTTTRSYQTAMPHATAIERMQGIRGWWRPDVFEAFMATVGAPR